MPDPQPFAPVTIETAPGRFRNIHSVRAAAEMLLSAWPEAGKGPAYAAATRACLNAVEGKTTPEVARRAFMIAAQEAGIFMRAG